MLKLEMGAQKGGDSRPGPSRSLPGFSPPLLHQIQNWKILQWANHCGKEGKVLQWLDSMDHCFQDTWWILRQCWRPGCLGEGEELTLKLSQGIYKTKWNRGPLGATSHSCKKLRSPRGQMAVRGRRTFQYSPRFENDKRKEQSILQAEGGRPVKTRLNVHCVSTTLKFPLYP